MKEILQSFLKNTEDKIRNPFIGAFISSWLLFNWKPLAFILLSTKIIEKKIRYVEIEFSSIWYLLVCPLISTLIYILVLPYVNLAIDELLKYSLLKRNNILIYKQKQNIESKKQLAIEEIKLEEAKSEFRERNTHNKLIDDLQNKIQLLEEQTQHHITNYESTIEQLRKQSIESNDIRINELKNSEKRYNESLAEISMLNQMIYQKDMELIELNKKSKLDDLGLVIKENILRFDDGLELIERVGVNNKIYIDRANNFIYGEKDFEEKFRYKKFTRL